MDNLVAFYHAIPSQAWVALFGGGSIVSLTVEVIKRLVKIKKVPKNWIPLTIHALTSVASMFVGVLPLFLHHQETFAVFGAYSAIMFTGANILYSFAKASLPVLQAISDRIVGLFPTKKTAADLPAAVESPTYEG